MVAGREAASASYKQLLLVKIAVHADRGQTHFAYTSRDRLEAWCRRCAEW